MHHSRLPGFSLVELVVALSLLSIVLIGGFFFFNTIQTGYLEQASSTNEIRTTRNNADTLFIAFHDNSSMVTPAVTAWPDNTSDNDTVLNLTGLWEDNSFLDDNGSYACRVKALDTNIPEFTIDADCYGDLVITEAELEDGLTGNPLPTALIIGASHGCIVTEVDTVLSDTTITVSNSNCLTDASGSDVSANASSGAGVVFPRFTANGQSKSDLLQTAYFDHFGDNRSGAGLYFGVEETYRDNTSTQYSITSSAAGDNFTSAWTNIDDFASSNALSVINPRSHSGFTIKVEALSSDTTVATSSAGTGSSALHFRSDQTLTALRNFLNNLHVRRTSSGDAIMRFHLGAGDFVWIRDLRLVLE